MSAEYSITQSSSEKSPIHNIVSYKLVAWQRPRNKQLNNCSVHNGRCWVIIATLMHATIGMLGDVLYAVRDEML
jgi:hypothetical protein